MKKLFILITVIILSSLSLSGCKGDGKASSGKNSLLNDVKDYPFTVDGVTFESSPKRVVSLSRGITDNIIELGYSSVLVGCDNNSVLPDELKNLPRVGEPINPDPDKITELNPNVVFADEILPTSIAKEFEDRKIPVVIIKKASGYSEFKSNIYTLSYVLAGKVAGKALADNSFAELDRILKSISESELSLPEIKGKNKICYLPSLNNHAATGDTFHSDIIELAGFVNVASGGTDWNFTLDQVVESKPDIIVCPVGLKSKIISNTKLKNLDAVKDGMVFEINTQAIEMQSLKIKYLVDDLLKAVYGKASSS